MFAYSVEQAKFKSILILQQTKHNEKDTIFDIYIVLLCTNFKFCSE